MANEKRLIDANALIRTLDQRDKKNSAYNLIMSVIIGIIDRQPTVEAEPVVHGRWLDGGKTFFGEQKNYICSNCHSHTGIVKFNYCPNCGAMMDGDGNG